MGAKQAVAGPDYAVGAWQGESPFTVEKPMFYEYWLYPNPAEKMNRLKADAFTASAKLRSSGRSAAPA